MTEHYTDLKSRLIVGHKRDGRACYDGQAKQELIAASLRPGVSVARLALDHGINANLLRKWIGKHQDRQQRQQPESTELSPAFIPVVPAAGAVRSPGIYPDLAVLLPNGVRLECAPMSSDQLSHLLRLLQALPCSASIRD